MGRYVKRTQATIAKSVGSANGVDSAFALSSFTPAFKLPQGYQVESDIKVFVGGIYQEPLQDYEIDAVTETITFGQAPGNSLRIVLISGENSTQAS